MVKKRIKDIIIGFIFGCILMTTTPVLANSIIQKIDVALNTVKVEVNGEKLDANNILYKGTTYLPIRAVAEAVGKNVDWNQDTMTASIMDENIKQEVNAMSNTIYTEEEYQNFISMFDIENNIYSDEGNTTNILCYIYNGTLSKNELRDYLNIKNYPHRDEMLKRLVTEKYADKTKNIAIQFWHMSKDENYILGAISKSINGEYEFYFQPCDTYNNK